MPIIALLCPRLLVTMVCAATMKRLQLAGPQIGQILSLRTIQLELQSQSIRTSDDTGSDSPLRLPARLSVSKPSGLPLLSERRVPEIETRIS